MGDNRHNIMWGCNNTDQRGTFIEQILDNNNINILNNGQATKISASTGNLSAIFLSFSLFTITPYLEWSTIPKLLLKSNDHFPIKITLNYINSDEKHTCNLT